MSNTRFLQTLFAFLLMCPCAAALAQAQTQTSVAGLQAADALGRDLFVESGSTGMVLVVVQRNQVLFRG